MGALGEFQPDMMQSINALFIVLFIPIFQGAIYPAARRIGLPCKPINKMTLGMLLCTALSHRHLVNSRPLNGGCRSTCPPERGSSHFTLSSPLLQFGRKLSRVHADNVCGCDSDMTS